MRPGRSGEACERRRRLLSVSTLRELRGLSEADHHERLRLIIEETVQNLPRVTRGRLRCERVVLRAMKADTGFMEPEESWLDRPRPIVRQERVVEILEERAERVEVGKAIE